MRDLGKDHALGSNQCPEMVEDALQVLSLYGQKRKLKKHGEDKEAEKFRKINRFKPQCSHKNDRVIHKNKLNLCLFKA